MAIKKQEVTLFYQTFRELGGLDTFPELNLEGAVKINLPKKYQGRNLSKEKKEQILEKLLIKHAKRKGYCALFGVRFRNDYNQIIADAASLERYINKSLVRQYEEALEEKKLTGLSDILDILDNVKIRDEHWKFRD